MTERLWYIDAIDPRAGLAVASQRDSDLMADLQEEAGPIAFIAPPAFAPEFVASRSLGFAMARTQGQLGLFTEEGEVPFDSLPDVVEFVRRAFLSGAAGAGGEGGEGGAAPRGGPSPVDGGDRERPLEGAGGEPIILRPLTPDEGLRGIAYGEGSPIAMLLTMASQFELSGEIPRGGSMPAERLQPASLEPDASVAAARSLVRGALHVIRALCSRRPQDWDAADALDWWHTAQLVVAIVNRMGLEPIIWTEVQRDLGHIWFSSQPRARGRLVDFIFDGRPDGYRYWAAYYGQPVGDVFATLGKLPVPVYLCADEADAANAQALLSAATAAPWRYFSDNDPVSDERAEIILFAAAFLNLHEDESALIISTSDLLIRFLADLSQRAQTWLADNLPKRIYASQVEELIAGVPRVGALPADPSASRKSRPDAAGAMYSA